MPLRIFPLSFTALIGTNATHKRTDGRTCCAIRLAGRRTWTTLDRTYSAKWFSFLVIFLSFYCGSCGRLSWLSCQLFSALYCIVKYCIVLSCHIVFFVLYFSVFSAYVTNKRLQYRIITSHHTSDITSV